jgi:methionine-rich copper-binding protein CopC
MLKFIVAALAGVLFLAPAWAHSALESSVPANGSTVTDPKTITLTFSDAVRLVTLKLKAADAEVVVPVDKSAAAAKSFSLPLPSLKPAKYEAKWTASADDGHVMTGSFSFTSVAGAGHKADHQGAH